MSPLDGVEVLVGAVIVLGGLYDLFQSVVLPRPSVGRVRLSPYLFRRLWRLWRWAGTRPARQPARESALAVFAPFAVLAMLATWIGLLILGYGLILFGLRAEVRPVFPDFGSALYLSSLALLTLGFGDIVPVGALARIVVVVEAATGLGVVAMVISLLFSLYGSFQRREVLVVTLDASAGAPPSGLQLLEKSARLAMPHLVEQTFTEWKLWSAEVLESHLAYPMLVYFRSSHDNEAWVNSFGAVMDAAATVLSVLEEGPRGAAQMMLKVGGHLVEDFGWYFRLPHSHAADTERSEFDELWERLRAAGYRLRGRDAAWEDFCRFRGQYADTLLALDRYLAVSPAPLLGERTYLPHADELRQVHL